MSVRTHGAWRRRLCRWGLTGVLLLVVAYGCQLFLAVRARLSPIIEARAFPEKTARVELRRWYHSPGEFVPILGFLDIYLRGLAPLEVRFYCCGRSQCIVIEYPDEMPLESIYVIETEDDYIIAGTYRGVSHRGLAKFPKTEPPAPWRLP